MTFPASYEGQRYEVRYKDGYGRDCCAGWTNDADGGALVRSIKRHPAWSDPAVVDLGVDPKLRKPT